MATSTTNPAVGVEDWARVNPGQPTSGAEDWQPVEVSPEGFAIYRVTTGENDHQKPGVLSRFFHSAIGAINPIPGIEEWWDRMVHGGEHNKAITDALHVGIQARGRAMTPEEQQMFNRGLEAMGKQDVGLTQPPIVPMEMHPAVTAGVQMRQGDIAGGLGTLAGAYGTPYAVGKGLQQIPKVVTRLQEPILRTRLNEVDAASQKYLEEHGINTPLSMQTGNEVMRDLEGSTLHSVGGGYAREQRQATRDAVRSLAQRELETIHPEPVATEEAGTAIQKQITQNIERQRAGMAEKVHPEPMTPELAGRNVINRGKQLIEGYDREADAAYKKAWEAERDPRNIQEFSVRDSEGNVVRNADGTIKTERMALAIDMTDIQKALKPIADRYEYTLRDTDARASLGLKAMRNIINGPRFKPASAAELDLGMLKDAARTEKGLSALRDPSQGLAALSVQELQEAIDARMAQAAYPGWDRASGTPSPALEHLRAGRANTAKKYDVQDKFSSFGKQNIEELEPVGVYRGLTWEGDAGIKRMRQIAQFAPDQMPQVGRAFIDGGGNWERLGPETKKILFKDPQVIKGLDAYYNAKETFDPLIEMKEPVALFDRITRAKGRANQILREVRDQSPDQMPKVGRAFLQGLLDDIQAKGDLNNVKSNVKKWFNLDDESKLMLASEGGAAPFPAAWQRVKDWNNLLHSLERLANEPNPSGSGYMVNIGRLKSAVTLGLAGTLGGLSGVGGHGGTVGAGLGLLAGAGLDVLSNKVLAHMLYNPKFTRLLTKGIQMQLKGNMAGARLTQNSLRKMIDEEGAPAEEPQAKK